MSEPILFYFDFVSPYGYLGSIGIEQLAAKHNRTVEWRPVLLGITILKVMGLKALPDTPLKSEYVAYDLVRSARYMGIAFKRAAGPIQPLAATRAFVWLHARDPSLAKRFGQAVYRAQWEEGRDTSPPEVVAELGAAIGIDSADLLAAIQDDGVKGALRTQVAAAIEAGIFGVPTFVADGEVFWGADRLPMLEHWLETGGW